MSLLEIAHLRGARAGVARLLSILALGTIACYGSLGTPEQRGRGTEITIPEVVAEIQAECKAVRSPSVGRPLPLAAHWNSGTRGDGFGPEYQLALLRKGRHILPWFQMPSPVGFGRFGSLEPEYYENALRQLAAWKLPVSFLGTQWERLLCERSTRSVQAGLRDGTCHPPEKGATAPRISPFGPLQPWRDVGMRWVSAPGWEALQRLYPDPPLVLFLSNNEATKLRWTDPDVTEILAQRLARRPDDDLKNRVVAEGFAARYAEMIQSMRRGLTAAAWQQNSLFVGYGAFGPPFLGRWYGWRRYSLYYPGHIAALSMGWQGASLPYYVHDWDPSTDSRVWSPQIEAMNWVFMKQEQDQRDPSFWVELSVWDGGEKKRQSYRELGQLYTPERYEGVVQFGMWLLTPRAVRDFRSSIATRKDEERFFDAILRSVDRVYASLILKRFWRSGELVSNPAHAHPYQTAIPLESRDVDRWFLLDTSLDPPRPWRLDTVIPVFALARSLGPPGSREWLLFAHSPLEGRKAVQIEVPGFGKATVDVPVSGSFYHLTEVGRTIQSVSVGEIMNPETADLATTATMNPVEI